MTRADLAEHLGLTVKTLVGWEWDEFLPSGTSLGLLEEWFTEDVPQTLIERDGMIGDRIRNTRLEWGMSTKDLAEHLGVTSGPVCLRGCFQRVFMKALIVGA